MALTRTAGRRCERCAGVLVYKPGHEATECRFCGELAPIPPVGAVRHHDYATASAAPRGALTGHEIACHTCGARAIVTHQATRCTFCDSPAVVELPAGEQLLPETVLPFAIDAPAARAGFERWMRSRWFAPGDLVHRSRVGAVDGVYLPYWSYASRTTTTYLGQRGVDYLDEERTWDHGEWKTRDVMKTKWWPASGTVEVAFDDVMVCASTSVPQPLADQLEPWDVPSLRPYDDRYLAGFTAERYGIDLEAGFALAEAKMWPRLQRAIHRDIGGDRQRIHHTSTTHARVTFQHALLPLWLAAFRYRGKVYRVTINARTGAISGERPWSVYKLAALAMLLGAVVFAIWWTQRG